MPFTVTWNAAFEAIPADSEDINLGASRIRTFKEAVQERVAIGHSFAGDNNDGLHLHVEFVPQGSVTPVNATDGVLYAALVSGVVELMYKDTAGNTVQLTSGGALRLSSIIVGGITNTFRAPAASPGIVEIEVDAGQASGYQLSTGSGASGPRWLLQKEATAESGGNVGSDFQIVRADDTGVVLGTPLKIYRINGYITMAELPTSMPVGVPGTLWNNAGVVNVST